MPEEGVVGPWGRSLPAFSLTAGSFACCLTSPHSGSSESTDSGFVNAPETQSLCPEPHCKLTRSPLQPSSSLSMKSGLRYFSITLILSIWAWRQFSLMENMEAEHRVESCFSPYPLLAPPALSRGLGLLVLLVAPNQYLLKIPFYSALPLL